MLSVAFQKAFPDDELQWQWDGRYNTVLAEFDSRHQEKVLGILGGFFTDYWYNACINDAPGTVQRINDFLGGLKPGQLFFSTDADSESFVYCAWWPWNVGKTISIRLSLAPQQVNDENDSTFRDNCLSWFNIKPAGQWGTV